VYACIQHEGPGGLVLNTEVLLGPDGAPAGLAPPAPVSFSSGLCFCHLNKAKHRIHRIQTAPGNTGSLEFVGAEVLARPAAAAPAPLAHPAYVPEPLDHPRARAYRVTLPPGAGATGPVEWAFSGVAVVLAGAPAAAALSAAARGGALRPGAAFWFDGPLTVDLGNDSDTDAAELLVVEWT
jgi:hypothetical protein